MLLCDLVRTEALASGVGFRKRCLVVVVDEGPRTHDRVLSLASEQKGSDASLLPRCTSQVDHDDPMGSLRPAGARRPDLDSEMGAGRRFVLGLIFSRAPRGSRGASRIGVGRSLLFGGTGCGGAVEKSTEFNLRVNFPSKITAILPK